MNFLAAIATLTLALTAAADDCESCVPGKRVAKLCEPHAAAEEAAISEYSTALRAKSPKDRIAALRALAAVTQTHANAPSAKLVKTLAKGLKDDAGSVRLETVKLLRDQHPEAALLALIPLVKPHLKTLKKVKEQRNKIDADIRIRRLETPRRAWSERDQAKEDKDTAELAALDAEREALDEMSNTIAHNLSAYPDGRAITLFKGLLTESPNLEVLEAVGKLGNVDAFELNVKYLPDYVKTWAQLDYMLKRAPASDPEELEKLLAKLRARVDVIHSRLEAIARTAGHTQDLPQVERDLHEQWQAWFKRHKKTLPAKFGRMAMPWD